MTIKKDENVLPNPQPDERGDKTSGQAETVYGRAAWNIQNDENWLRDLTLGRRIEFYEVKGDLGRGNFSSVKLAVHSITEEMVAVKVINKINLNEKTTKMLLREILAMDASNHPHLVRLFGVVETTTKVQLVMQLATGGDLFTQLTEHGKFSEPRASNIFGQVACAVNYMHEQGMIHRDIKAENVFFISKNKVVVGDFGFATQLENMGQHLNTFCGSPPYAAPELFQDDHYLGPTVDIWSLGILLYFLVTGTLPFKAVTVASLKQAILKAAIIIPHFISYNCQQLIQNLLKRRPGSRYSMKQIASCYWLAGFEWVGEDKEYRPYPRFDPSKLSDFERVVQDELAALGIPEDMLRTQLNQGVRSPLIATYRILLHKQMQRILSPETENEQKPSIVRKENKRRGVRVENSKTCVLL